MAQQPPVLHLDTHVVCWLYAGRTDHLSERVQILIEQHTLHISPWVLCELQAMHEKGVLTLPAAPLFDDLERRLGLQIAPGEASAIAKASFAMAWAQDPYDRMIVAHAKLAEVPLASKDAHLHTHFPQVVW